MVVIPSNHIYRGAYVHPLTTNLGSDTEGLLTCCYYILALPHHHSHRRLPTPMSSLSGPVQGALRFLLIPQNSSSTIGIRSASCPCGFRTRLVVAISPASHVRRTFRTSGLKSPRKSRIRIDSIMSRRPASLSSSGGGGGGGGTTNSESARAPPAKPFPSSR